MARDIEIAKLREQTDLVALVGESVVLMAKGRCHTGACPKCGGDLHVNGALGFFHCFGCKESGGAIDWVMLRDGASFGAAFKMLASRATEKTR